MIRKMWIAAALAIPLSAQTPEMTAINSAAAALGGADHVKAAKTLVIEGEGANPNVG